MLDEPDAIRASVEDMPFAVHLAGKNGEQRRCSMTRAHVQGDSGLGGKMDMMPLHLEQALFANGIEEPCRGAMIEQFGRRLWCILQFNFNRMPLACPDTQAIGTELKALLRIRRDDVFQVCS